MDVGLLGAVGESDEVSNQRGKAAIGRQHQQGQGHSTTQPQGLQWSPMGPANADIIDLAAERHAAEPKHLPAQLQGAQLFPKPTEVPHPVELKLLELQRSTAEPLFVRPQHGTGIVWQSEALAYNNPACKCCIWGHILSDNVFDPCPCCLVTVPVHFACTSALQTGQL